MFVLASMLVSGRRVAAMRVDGRYWPVAAAARAAGVDGLEGELEALFSDWRGALPRLKRVAKAIAAGATGQ